MVLVKSVYGKTLFYPANDNALNIARLANTKTLSKNDLGIAEKLGFKISFVHEEITLT